jgi:hypothetical protein
MRWLALVLILPLLACESRVIVSRSPSTQTAPASATPAVSGSPTATPSPVKVALRPATGLTTATRLLSYERVSDIPVAPTLRLVLTDDGRVVTEDASGELVQRKLTPSGAAAMVLQAIETGLFDRDASHPRVPVPGTTPPARGPIFFVLVVANGPRDVRISFEPSGQPDDELYQRSPTRDKLTALARAYEDLSSIPASHWVESKPQPYQPAAHRLFVLAQPNTPPAGAPARQPSDVDEIWPFLTQPDRVGDQVGTTPWRCAILVDGDALTLGVALARAFEIPRYGWGSRIANVTLAWERARGSMRLEVTPLLPHQPATCDGAAPPPF